MIRYEGWKISNVIFDLISLLVRHYQLFLILPIILALKAEKHYVGRASILANTVGMFVSVAPYWDATRSWLNIRGFPLFHAYILLGLVFGLIAFLSYIFEVSQEGDFYMFTFVLYNSVIAGIVCFVASVFL
jgi:ABC-type transport system involved in cytochrome c biogenesis permease subunit